MGALANAELALDARERQRNLPLAEPEGVDRNVLILVEPEARIREGCEKPVIEPHDVWRFEYQHLSHWLSS